MTLAEGALVLVCTALMTITARTQLVTLLGHPVEHSRSPTIHNAAFQAQGVNAVYVATPVHPEAIGDAVAGLRAMQVLGANVTIPHKQTVMPHLDALTERAHALGAVNTIVRERDGKTLRLRGDNTDGAGFLRPLAPHADALLNGEAVVFGAGGAARAVVHALLDRLAPSRLTVVARRPAQAEALAEAMAPFDANDGLRTRTFETAQPAVKAAHLLVNATPLGMVPDVERTPWPEARDFSEGQIAYDLVYNPAETRFLQDAAARGATPIGGWGMLIGQAAVAYSQWTGRDFPHDAVAKALSRNA